MTTCSPKIIGEAVDSKSKLIQMRVLLDSGTSSCLVLRKCTPRKLRHEKGIMKWKMMDGRVCTSNLATTNLVLPEFH
eukprot:CAMPEP_0198132694 /NCGR_PEP_ID=MMETSP1442-20131203/58905_1 /TAXON_ID= /ORGANISM="Craspedostauros australis, Strain CCMP3328" /LENGTH=76 /DNA_ID=CAMNT_0043793759 /DNA_START=326 /DNA_END=553 /DNA_ORIENTATION=-